MLYSMTGHGEGHSRAESCNVHVELRSINNRYLKVVHRTSDGYQCLEPEIEAFVRKHVKRGSVQVNVRVSNRASADDYSLNDKLLAKYVQQLSDVQKQLSCDTPINLGDVLALPGVVVESASRAETAREHWPVIQEAIEEALTALNEMRTTEGAHMAADLSQNMDAIASALTLIEERAPVVVAAYQTRLLDRLKKLLEEFDVAVEPADVVREVGIYSERADISEETVRLRSHLKQFGNLLKSGDSNGKKLEFLTQEMLRETNTIGSKANDAPIANHVIEIKASIERIREMIQNVE